MGLSFKYIDPTSRHNVVSSGSRYVEAKLLGGDAADDIKEASETQASAMQAGLDYFMETEKIPSSLGKQGCNSSVECMVFQALKSLGISSK